ncbi:MAG: DUF2200 domain-containing protein [Flavobacteriales bacterium]|nr:DUF2200 domain-containing protein [Flavobacteriales bacterium]
MTTTPEHDQRIAELTFASVYPHYVSKVQKKNRSEEDLLEVIKWLTGFNSAEIEELITSKATFKEFFERATLNPNANQIKGVICGYRIEDIITPLTKQVRYLDKLVDELAKGRAMDKILRV